MTSEYVPHPLVAQTADFMRGKLATEATGHDWWHAYRVWHLARTIGTAEKCDLLTAELGALLHDIHDWKFAEGSTEVGADAARHWLEECNAPLDVTDNVVEIVRHVSFKGAGVPDYTLPLAGQVVRDADRLDAIGAVGIARTFAYGGAARRPIHDPNVKPQLHTGFEEYRKAGGGSRNHFDEKLLLLKDRMHTAAGCRIAEERHTFMTGFLNRFDAEWDGADV